MKLNEIKLIRLGIAMVTFALIVVRLCRRPLPKHFVQLAEPGLVVHLTDADQHLLLLQALAEAGQLRHHFVVAQTGPHALPGASERRGVVRHYRYVLLAFMHLVSILDLFYPTFIQIYTNCILSFPKVIIPHICLHKFDPVKGLFGVSA